MMGLTRFSGMPRWTAWLTLVTVAAIIVTTFFTVDIPAVPVRIATPSQRVFSDVKLYRSVVTDVLAGHSYYPAIAAEQRAHSYPTRPGQVIREPTLALLLAFLRADWLRTATLVALLGLVMLCLRSTLAEIGISLPGRLAIMAGGLTGVFSGAIDSIYLHENWAALLIALAIVVYRPERWITSMTLGLVACAIRELAFPFLLAMAAFAVLERRTREAVGWLASGALFLTAYAAHLHFAEMQSRPGDLSSQGWLFFGGLPFVLATARWNFLFYIAPNVVVAAGACFGLLGLIGSRDPRASRSALVVGGYMFAFAVVGRPDNYTWGILYAPLLAIGLVLAPFALRDLLNRAFAPAIGHAATML